MPKSPEERAHLNQQKVLTVLNSQFNGYEGEVDAESLFNRSGLGSFRGVSTPSGKLGEILGSAKRILEWFKNQGLITVRDATEGRGKKQFAVKITEKGRKRLEQLQRSISLDSDTTPHLEIVPDLTPRLSESEQVAIRRRVYLSRANPKAKAAVERRKAERRKRAEELERQEREQRRGRRQNQRREA